MTKAREHPVDDDMPISHYSCKFEYASFKLSLSLEVRLVPTVHPLRRGQIAKIPTLPSCPES